jgi:predicted naringenin-chalcone synthase
MSLGYAVPKWRNTQSEILEALGWKGRLAKSIFAGAGIDERYSYIDPARFKDGLSWQELCDEYRAGALELGVAAARDAFGPGFDVERIGLITFASVTGYTCPSMSYPIAAELGLRSNVVHSDLLGMGCEAAHPALERAVDYVKAHPDQLALSVSAEVCSATLYPAEETDREYLVSSAIFGDASSAAIVGYSDQASWPQVVDFESFYSPEYLDLLGYKWENGMMKVVLSKEVPNVVPPLIAKTVNAILARNSLVTEDIAHWIIHPGGKAVLENIEKELGLNRAQTHWSWEVMRKFGNVSSATLGIIAKHVQQNEHPYKGWGIVATMGAGTAVNAALIHWG